MPDTYNLGSLLSHLRAFGTAGLCTFALFAIAAWFPNGVIDFVAWLIAIFLGLPLSILAKVYAGENAAPNGRINPGILTLLIRVFGALSLLLGVGILGWQAYYDFVRRLPGFTSVVTIAQALLSVALIGFGYRLLCRPLLRRVSSNQRDAA